MANARGRRRSRGARVPGRLLFRQVLLSAPLLGEARLLQVAPVATFVGLGGPTLVRLTPHDGVGAVAIARWLVASGVGEVLVVHDHDPGYGVPVGTMCAEAALERGVSVSSRPVWDEGAWGPATCAAPRRCSTWASQGRGRWRCGTTSTGPTAALAAGRGGRRRAVAGARATALGRGADALLRRPACLVRPVRVRGHVPDPRLDRGGNRAAAVEAARGTRDRDSVIGRYSIDHEGHTTSSCTAGSPSRTAIWSGIWVPRLRPVTY